MLSFQVKDRFIIFCQVFAFSEIIVVGLLMGYFPILLWAQEFLIDMFSLQVRHISILSSGYCFSGAVKTCEVCLTDGAPNAQVFNPFRVLPSSICPSGFHFRFCFEPWLGKAWHGSNRGVTLFLACSDFPRKQTEGVWGSIHNCY